MSDYASPIRPTRDRQLFVGRISEAQFDNTGPLRRLSSYRYKPPFFPPSKAFPRPPESAPHGPDRGRRQGRPPAVLEDRCRTGVGRSRRLNVVGAGGGRTRRPDGRSALRREPSNAAPSISGRVRGRRRPPAPWLSPWSRPAPLRIRPRRPGRRRSRCSRPTDRWNNPSIEMVAAVWVSSLAGSMPVREQASRGRGDAILRGPS